MEVLAIVAGCASLLGAISKLTKEISVFVHGCRDARGDMDMVRRELASLAAILELIESDAKEHGQHTFPVTLAGQIDGIVHNCNSVLGKMTETLEPKGGRMDKARWAATRRDRVVELRMSLEAHKTSLELALDLLQLSLARDTNNTAHLIMSDTQEIRDVTGAIAQDTGVMRGAMGAVLEELARLRAQVAEQPTRSREEQPNVVLARFLEDMTSYAETVSGDISDVLTPRHSLEHTREFDVPLNGDVVCCPA
jgi:hypothetical protein